MSEDLADKFRKALCIAHEYWCFQEWAADKKKEIEQRRIKAIGWKEELNCLINLARRRTESRVSATQEQRDELERLLEERVRNKQTQEHLQSRLQAITDDTNLGKGRWIEAWAEV
jgi:hypothetical protein